MNESTGNKRFGEFLLTHTGRNVELESTASTSSRPDIQTGVNVKKWTHVTDILQFMLDGWYVERVEYGYILHLKADIVLI